jgi:phosphoribosylanthranilate isomerase
MFIKICGITSVTDARMVASAGANAIGLNFFSDSPRCVGLDVATEIAQALPPFVDAVGLFVNASPAQIRETAHAVGVRTVQLHGQLSPQMVVDLSEFAVVPAFPLVDDSSVAAVESFVAECRRLGRLPAAVLVDAHVPDKFGGTGKTAPWHLARAVVQRCPVPVTLAGGLTPKNVGEAVRAVRPWGVDVATGVEVAPGRKEVYKVSKFVEQVRQASS